MIAGCSKFALVSEAQVLVLAGGEAVFRVFTNECLGLATTVSIMIQLCL